MRADNSVKPLPQLTNFAGSFAKGASASGGIITGRLPVTAKRTARRRRRRTFGLATIWRWSNGDEQFGATVDLDAVVKA